MMVTKFLFSLRFISLRISFDPASELGKSHITFYLICLSHLRISLYFSFRILLELCLDDKRLV